MSATKRKRKKRAKALANMTEYQEKAHHQNESERQSWLRKF